MMIGKDLIEVGVYGTAGAGKTTKLLELTENDSRTFDILAFNRMIASEVRSRVKNKKKYDKELMNINDISTIDSLAFGIVSVKSYSNAELLFKKEVKNRYGFNLFNEDSQASSVWNSYIRARNKLDNYEINMIKNRSNVVALCDSVEENLAKDKKLTFQKTRELAYEWLLNGDDFEIESDVIIVDEIQDVSLLQWNLIAQIAKKNKSKIWVAGDIYQTIYQHLGADFNLSGEIFNNSKKLIELKYSNRVPKAMEKMVKWTLERFGLDSSKFNCIKEGGEVNVVGYEDLPKVFMSEIKRWKSVGLHPDAAVLFRTRQRKSEFIKTLRNFGVFIFPYERSFYQVFELFEMLFMQNFNKIVNSFGDLYDKLFDVKPEELQLNRFDKNMAFRSFIENISYDGKIKKELWDYYNFNKGYKKPEPINFVTVTTIHKMKGAERELVFTDLYSPKVEGVSTMDEGCVKFVGLTRAKKKMWVVS